VLNRREMTSGDAGKLAEIGRQEKRKYVCRTLMAHWDESNTERDP
jgi:hypothetical protein